MLKLFQSIFGIDEPDAGRYPEDIVQMAIERAVDGTDSRIRLLTGYRDKLRPSVLRAIDHVVPLVDGLPGEVELSRENYRDSSLLGALFASVDHMRQVLREDTALRDCIAAPPGSSSDQVYALLLAVRSERNVLGMELQGDIVRRDVRQVAVSFGPHMLMDATADRIETTRMLRRRAFDHLLEIALKKIVSVREERADVQRQRGLLKSKFAALEKGDWGFGAAGDKVQHYASSLESSLEAIEDQLQGLGSDSEVLESHLRILIDVLDHAHEQLWSESVTETIDSMGIRREPGAAGTRTLELQELRSALGPRDIPLRVTIPRREFPERPDVVREAQRYLG